MKVLKKYTGALLFVVGGLLALYAIYLDAGVIALVTGLDQGANWRPPFAPPISLLIAIFVSPVVGILAPIVAAVRGWWQPLIVTALASVLGIAGAILCSDD